MKPGTSPFNTALIEQRLKEALPQGTLRQVAGAAEFATVTQLQDFPAPCAYVLLARESFDDVKDGMAFPGEQSAMDQPVRVTFGVVLAMQNYREQRGAQLSPDLVALLGQVRGVLLGYVPPVPGGRACKLRQGDLTHYDAGTLLWTDVWQTKHTIGVAP